jgi:hypothetical protein
MAEKELLTAAKLAESWGVSVKVVKDAITKAAVAPDSKKGPCLYYGPETAKKIKAAIKK